MSERRRNFLSICGLLFATLAAVAGFLIATAHLAEKRAQATTQALDSVKFGSTSENESMNILSSLHDRPQREQCSSVEGQCKGLYVYVENYPVFASTRGVRIGRALTRILTIRPSVVELNLYFVNGRLESAATIFRVGHRSVGVAQYSTSKPFKPRLELIGGGATGKPTAIRAAISARVGDSPNILQQFDLHCMMSTTRCDDPRVLWPSAPPPSPKEP